AEDGIRDLYVTGVQTCALPISYHIAGDLPDLQSLHLEVLDTSINAASACRVGFVRHSNLRALMQAHPRLGDVFWRAGLIDAAMRSEERRVGKECKGRGWAGD